MSLMATYFLDMCSVHYKNCDSGMFPDDKSNNDIIAESK